MHKSEGVVERHALGPPRAAPNGSRSTQPDLAEPRLQAGVRSVARMRDEWSSSSPWPSCRCVCSFLEPPSYHQPSGTGAQTAVRPITRSHPFGGRALSFSPPKSPLDQSVNFGPCPKRAQTQWHKPSSDGLSWHGRAVQSVYQFACSALWPALIMLRWLVRLQLAPQSPWYWAISTLW